MPATSSGKLRRLPARRKEPGRSLSTSTKLHRFESFTHRIAKLSIQPVARYRGRTDIDARDTDASTSHFRQSFNNWRDMNLSTHFSAFVHEIDPLCDSLAQILHHQSQIVEILLRYIADGNPLSLEPLLSLLSALAHDLAHRFEPFFAQALMTVRDIVTKQRQEVEVLEWSFEALAWMFKYLSRLLVPDLRPTFDIMAPLLGRAQQKAHIARFAAEAMAFLIRKSAMFYRKDNKPLDQLMRHAMGELEALEEQGTASDTFEYGLMTLFAESIKGINQDLHSCGTTVFGSLLHHAHGNAGARVVVGAFVNLLHNTTAGTSGPLFEVIQSLTASVDTVSPSLLASLLFHGATLRDGSRIGAWEPVLHSVASLKAKVSIENPDIGEEVDRARIAICANGPLSSVLPEIRRLMTTTSTRGKEISVVSLAYFHRMNPKRCTELLGRDFRRYIATKQTTQCDEVLLLLLRLVALFTNSGSVGRAPDPVLLKDWVDRIASSSVNSPFKFTEEQIYRQNALLEVASMAPLDSFLESLLLRLEDLLSGASSGSISTKFLLGRGLEALLNAQCLDSISKPIKIFEHSWAWTTPIHLENLSRVCEAKKLDLTTSNFDDLIQKLVSNLSSSSSSLRKASLSLLQQTYRSKLKEPPPFFNTALSVETTPFDLEAVRKITLCINQLSHQYEAISDDPILQQAIPHFLFGILTYQLSGIWPAAIEAVKSICNGKQGEKTVSSLVFEWIDVSPGAPPAGHISKSEDTNHFMANEFQCIKSEAANRTFAEVQKEFDDSLQQLKDRFETSHYNEPIRYVDARMQALRVLKNIPWLAEKKSRQLVPLFLEWTSKDSESSNLGGPGEEAIKSTRQERLLALDIFAAFQNPIVLYRSSETYEALLELLKSPEVEFQKRALRAILSWKQPAVVDLESVLKMVLDDTRFRDGILELSKSIHSNGELSQTQAVVMPILLRILFGRMTASSKYSNNSNQSSKRRAVFDALSRFADEELRAFLQTALGHISLEQLGGDNEGAVATQQLRNLPVRRKLGLINMVKDMVRFFGDRLLFLIRPLAKIALACSEQNGMDSVRSSGNFEDALETQGLETVEERDDLQEAMTGESDEILLDEQPYDTDTLEDLRKREHSLVPGYTSPLSTIRRLGLQCITLLFARLMSPELAELMPKVYEIFINDKVERLAEETAYSVSNLLKLLSTWAADENAHGFLMYSETLLYRLVDILKASPKEEVQVFVLVNILTPFFRRQIAEKSLQPTDNSTSGWELSLARASKFLEHTLQTCYLMLQTELSKQAQASVVDLITCLVTEVSEPGQMFSLLQISCNLLEQPPSRVSPKTKSDILGIAQQLVPKMDLAEDDQLFQRVFQTISQLFGYFKDRDSRLKLCTVLEHLSVQDFEISAAANYCSNLNAFSTTLVEEPDFDRRREAYESIVKLEKHALSAKQWIPILYNLVFYIKETDELGVGSNACFALCAFAKHAGHDQSLVNLVRSIILPAIQRGVHERSEGVRREYLKVLATIVRELPNFEDTNDLRGLLMDEDEEANIFNNILHIQQHRRIRALRRLASPQVSSPLRSTTVAHFLIPLIEHSIIDRDDDAKAGDLAAEAVNTIGHLLLALEWHQARGLLTKYLRIMSSKPELERSILKLVGALTDAIAKAVQAGDTVNESSRTAQKGIVHEMTEQEEKVDAGGATPTLSKTLVDSEALSLDISDNLLPPLTKFLHHKDDNVVSLRIPAAVSAAKLMMMLSPEKISARLAPMLTDVCHVLRSRTPESRDLCRKALADITRIIGPPYFGFVLKELRGALQRGYQLHVLSFTMHTLLVEAGPSYDVGSLDHCMFNAVAIIMDDIFGVVGMEKDAEGYTSKMKEVKQSKSFDSMELLARLVSLERLNVLISPVQALLQEKLDLKVARKVDELLRRISVGLLKNPTAGDQRVLIFAYELIQMTYASNQAPTKGDTDRISKRFIVNLKGARASHTQSGSLFCFKIIKFAFDVVRSVVQKFESLKTVRNLEGFMPVVGDAIVEGEDEVQMSALRLLASIMKLPLKALEADGPSYVSAAVGVIKNTASNDSDMAQAAFKLIAATLRDREDIEIEESDIAYLLKRLQPDLERYDNQGFIFNLLKSVVGRKYLIPEVYRIMDVVRAMMVTSHSRETQNMSRAVYFQFITNYPQSEKRQDEQITFLGKNVDYPQVDGRKSVLEAIHRLLSKDIALAQKVIRFLFEPLVFVMIMDDSADCRKMASLLLGICFEKAEGEMARIFSLTKEWLMLDYRSSEKAELQVRAAFQLYTLWVEIDTVKAEGLLPVLFPRITEIVELSVAQESNDHWAVLFYALRLLKKLTEQFPERALHKKQSNLWRITHRCAGYPHTWIKHISAELLGNYLAEYMGINAAASFPLVSRHGLVLEADPAYHLVKRSLRTLQLPLLTTELAELTIRNLATFAKLSQSAPALLNGADAMVDEDEISGVGSDNEAEQPAKSIVQLIFHHLSWAIQRDPSSDKAAAIVSKTASLKLCRALCNDTPIPTLEPLLPVVLRPIYRLTTPNIPTPFSIDEGFKSAWKDSVALAHEIIDLLQKRLGSAVYIRQMGAVQEDARARRDERRTKRRIEAVAAPDKALYDKRRKHERTKERRKEKNRVYRERRRGF